MNQFRARLYFTSTLLLLFCGAVVLRLFLVQVIDGQRYAARSRDQSQHRRLITARRGSILDRRGRALAINVPAGAHRQRSRAAGISQSGNHEFDLRRVYPLGDVAGPLLGYIGKDGYGLGGVEFAFDSYLRGEDGWTIIQKDGRNRRYRKIGLPEKGSRDGCDVYLTIDMEAQKIVQSVLRQTVERLQARGGMCVVMDPRDGRVFAMANEPSFDPNVPANYSLAQRQNKCISYTYEPGSTFKLITAASALQEGIKRENDTIFGNNGVFEIYHESIRDHVPYGKISFVEALKVSSNVCFAKIANEVGSERLYRYVKDFGFGTRTGIDLPGEETGIVHPVRSWSGRTRVTMAIGQELTVTLMQMVLPFAAVANGGILIRPRIHERVASADGALVDSSGYRAVRRIVSESTAARLRGMLAEVVKGGTGKNAGIDGIDVAGKTGTSQKPDSGTYSNHLSWSSFIGFLPADNPVLLCGVVIDEPAAGEMGAVAAAPAFKRIVTQLISHPELEFAERILRDPVRVPGSRQQHTVPLLCNLTRHPMTAADSTPGVAGRRDVGNRGGRRNLGPVAVSSGSRDAHDPVPDCIGKDLRDAISVLNTQGLTPYAVGMGTVRRQAPAAGTLTRPAVVCTLVCSLEG